MAAKSSARVPRSCITAAAGTWTQSMDTAPMSSAVNLSGEESPSGPWPQLSKRADFPRMALREGPGGQQRVEHPLRALVDVRFVPGVAGRFVEGAVEQEHVVLHVPLSQVEADHDSHVLAKVPMFELPNWAL